MKDMFKNRCKKRTKTTPKQYISYYFAANIEQISVLLRNLAKSFSYPVMSFFLNRDASTQDILG